jgi:hypothetical protein|tara:strand:+ start:3856 stop:4017 length:162 start_codon:yes stop_codon:yes gene_type:complete
LPIKGTIRRHGSATLIRYSWKAQRDGMEIFTGNRRGKKGAPRAFSASKQFPTG